MARRNRAAVLFIAVLTILGLGSLTAARADAAVNPTYDRTAAVNWALAHAQDPQGSGALCTWFVSQALWAGGLSQTPDWGVSAGQGTYDATYVQGLVGYLVTEAPYSVTWTNITGDLTTNAVPGAEPGDIIVYSWDGTELDHMDLVVGIASGDYPEVSGWSEFNNFTPLDYLVNPTSSYVERGWTWSVINNEWLQTKNPNMQAYLLHINGGYFTPTF